MVTKRHENTTVGQNSDGSCSSMRSVVTVATLSNRIPADSALVTSFAQNSCDFTAEKNPNRLSRRCTEATQTARHFCEWRLIESMQPCDFTQLLRQERRYFCCSSSCSLGAFFFFFLMFSRLGSSCVHVKPDTSRFSVPARSR